MKMVRVLWVLLIAAATPSLAQVDKHVFKCESTASKAITKHGGDTAKCIQKCETARLLKGETRTCSTKNPDPNGDPNVDVPLDAETAGCVSKSESKYTTLVSKKCANLLPACGSFVAFAPADTAGYAASQLDNITPLVTGLVETYIFCAPITDPKDPAQSAAFKCEAKTSKELSKFSKSIIKCTNKCYQRRDTKGETGLDCNINHLAATLDPETKTCVTDARAKSNGKIGSACASFPTCGAYTGGTPDSITNFVLLQFLLQNPDDGFCATS